MIENGMSLRSTVDDFIESFESNLSKYATNKAAYDAAERRHFQVTGSYRYAGGYDSFRQVHRRRRDKRRRK